MRVRRTKSEMRWSTALLILMLVGLLAVATACGSDDDDGDAGAAGTTTSETTGGSDDLVAEAKELMEQGKQGLLYYGGPEPDAEPGDMEVLAAGDWRGPTESPDPGESRKLHVISCLAGSGCEVVGRAAAKAAEALGWDVEFVQAQGTPESYNTTFASAIAERPDGIITVAVPASQVADKIAEAREAGIKLVATAAVPEGGADEYDSYVQIMEALTSQMQAWWAIADSNGTAKVVLLWDYGFPHLVQGGDAAVEELERCSGCEVLEVRKRTVTEAADPVAMQRIVNSLIQKYGDDLEYILTPYGFGVAPVIEAVRASGRTDIKVLSKNAEVQNLGAVASGDQAADFAAPIDWAGWAAVDNMIRLFAGEEPLETHEHGLAVHVFEQDNSPEDGNVDWTPFVDFESKYKELWGIQ